MHFSRKAFTLIELLVVIAVIAILSVVVILTLNPAELLRQSRDSGRVSDMSTLTSGINLYATDQSAASNFFLGTSSVVYVSIPDPAATSTAGDQCQGLGLLSLPSDYAYRCAASSTYRATNGTGWIPVNLQAISSGSPLGSLPVDPANQSSTRLYYTYTTNGTQFELTAPMESAKYKLGGTGDVIGPDGATLSTVYAKGTNLALEPLDYGDASLVGYWPLTEGTGTVAYDDSGNNATGSYTSVSWSQGKIGPYAVSVGNGSYGQNGYVSFGTRLPASSFTLSFWMSPSGQCPSTDFCINLGGDLYLTNGFRSGFIDSPFYAFSTNQDAGTIGLTAVGSSSVGVWDFIDVTYANGTALLYRNGVLQASTTGTYVPGTTMFLDAGVGGVNWFWGSVNDVRMYNRALAASEVAAMYGGGK